MSKKRKLREAQKKIPAPQVKRQKPSALWPIFAAAVIVFAAAALVYARVHALTIAASPQPSPSAFAGDHYPSQGHQGHTPGDTQRYARFQYSSDPPTSGYHREIFTDAFVNTKPIPKDIQVHMLEHGNILLQYNCICPQIAQQLKEIADRFDLRLLPASATQPTPQDIQNSEERGVAVIVAPYPSMRPTIALTAWTRLASLPAVDQTKIISFINQWLTNSDNLNQ